MTEVLVLCDDFWHPGEVVREGLRPLEGDSLRFTIVEDAKDMLTPQWIAQFPVIVNCKSNQLTSANINPWFDEGVTEVGPAELQAYVEQGGGLLAVHAGNAFFKDDCTAYTDLVGNYFIEHPPRCDVQVRVTAQHPVTDEVEDFQIRDEHYRIALTREDTTELLRTTSETGGDQVGGYVRQVGKGRICVLTPGHILSVWRHPVYQRLLQNAIHWCAGQR